MIRGEWCVFRGLEDDSVATNKRRHDFPGGNGHGEIPRRDQPADADRLANAHGEFVGEFRRRRLTKKPAAFAGHVIGHVDGFLDVTARLGKDLAHFAGHVFGEFFLAFDKKLCRAKKNFRSLGGRDEPPGFIGFTGGENGSVDVRLGREWEFANDLLGVSGIVIQMGFIAGRREPLAVDEILEHARRGGGGHGASWEKMRIAMLTKSVKQKSLEARAGIEPAI